MYKCTNPNCHWKGTEPLEPHFLQSTEIHDPVGILNVLCPLCATPVEVDTEAVEKKAEVDKKNLYPIYQYFAYKHLPPHLQQVSKLFGDLAETLLDTIPDGPEKAEGFRKLLEAKDCMVRASLNKR